MLRRVIEKALRISFEDLRSLNARLKLLSPPEDFTFNLSDRVTAMSNVIRVKPTHDGTYTVYRGEAVLVSGLTRLQAERYEAGLATRAGALAHG